MADFTTALEKRHTFTEPEDAPLYCGRAESLWLLGEEQRAVADASTAISIKADAGAYIDRALARDDAGDIEGARSDYRSAITLDSKDAIAYDDLGWLEFRLGQVSKAMADYEKAMGIDSKHPLAWRNRALVWFDRQQWDKALSDYRRAAKLDPTDPYAHIRLYLILARCHDPAARRELDTGLANLTDDVKSQWPGQVLQYLQGDLSDEALMSAAHVGSRKAVADQLCEGCFYRGELALMRGDDSEARHLLTEALKSGARTTDEYFSAQAELESLSRY
ncbi:MAG TPA: tetratricopeptide repeat protein [Candidatus Xenobia bacterium]